MSIHEVVNVLVNLFGSVQYILKGSLKMCQTVTKLLPCLLTEGKENLVNMRQDLQVVLESDTFHSKDNHRCWDRGVQVQPSNQATVIWVQELVISTTNKSNTSPLKCRQHILRFFDEQRVVYLLNYNMFPSTQLAFKYNSNMFGLVTVIIRLI